MKALRYDAPYQISILELPAPVPAAGEVLLKMISVGVCGSDMQIYHAGGIGTHFPGHRRDVDDSGMLAALQIGKRLLHGAMPVSGQALSVYAAKTGRRESNACTSGHRRRKAGGRKPDKNESKA